jgi:hypothetical protein
MIKKFGAPVVLLLAGALLSRTLLRDSPPDTQTTIHPATAVMQPAPPTLEGLQVFETTQPPPRENRRNLFAFTEVPVPPRPRVDVPTSPPKTEIPRVEQKVDKPQRPQDPEFPMRFIGTFGFNRDPIAVFAANGEIKNAKVGDVVADGFKLAAIGIESVDVSTPQGGTQRISMTR